MAIVELQVREEAFARLITDLVNDRRLPSATLKDPAHPSFENFPLDGIICVGCVLEPGPMEGQVAARLDLQIRYYESYADARAAGSLQQPPTHTRQQLLPLTFEVRIDQRPDGPRPVLAWSVFLNLFPGDTIDLGALGAMPTQRAAIVLDGGVVAIRLGSDAADDVLGPVTNRLVPGSDWTQVVPGAVLARTLVSALAAAVDGFVDGATYVVGDPASGSYVTTPVLGQPPPPFALAEAEVIAVDACLFDIDVSVALRTLATFEADRTTIRTTVHLSWSADSTWCEIAGGLVLTPVASVVIANLVADKVNEAVLGAGGPDGFTEIARSEESITYRQEQFLDFPHPLVLTTSAFTHDGLVIGGSVRQRQRGPALQGWARSPLSELDVDCSARNVTVTFSPARVELHDHSRPGGPPKLFLDWTRFDPPDAWRLATAAGNSSSDLVVECLDPPGGRLPAGTATSVYLMTDCGLRWVDLGVIPADRPPPTLGERAEMINRCMAISAGWLERVLEVLWLPRPPEGLQVAPLRQWLVGLRELAPGTRLELVAVGRDGEERLLGAVEADGRASTSMPLQLVTEQDETLRIRTSDPGYRAVPSVAQRWIRPTSSEPILDAAPSTIAAVGGVLGVADREGAATIIDTRAGAGTTRAEWGIAAPGRPSRQRVIAALARERGRGRAAWASAVALDANTVAVVHRGALVIGTVGPTQRL